MPLDGKQFLIDDAVLTLLIRGRQRIEAGWCQGIDKSGARVCAGTAIDAFRPGFWRDDIHEQALRHLSATLKEIAPAYWLPAWNDRPDRTQADVLALYDRAIELRMEFIGQ